LLVARIKKKVNTGDFTYTEDQIKCIAAITEFLRDSARRIFQLTGRPGVGKTEVLKYFGGNGVVYLTPTHKAKHVLSERVKGLVMTIHRFLGISMEYDKEGRLINITNDHSIEKNMEDVNVLILDEASMVPFNLYEALVDNCYIYNVKLITSGDRHQLPPVVAKRRSEMNECELADEPPFYHYLPIDFELKVNVRNDNTEYNALLDSIRDALDANDYSFTTYAKIKDLMCSTACVNISERPVNNVSYMRETLHTIVDAFWSNDGGDEVVMLAHRTNPTKIDTVSLLNKVIREFKFGENPARFNEGERLLFTNYYEGHDGFNTVKYNTCDKIVVNDLRVESVKYHTRTFDVYVMTDIQRGVNLRYPKTDKDLELFKESALELRAIVKRKIKHMTDSVMISAEWRKFFRERDSVKAPIDYSYALSIHKSQGSSYGLIYTYISDFVWMANHKNTQHKKQFYRLLYVALSRSKTNSIVF